jgi:hypothetical protein
VPDEEIATEKHGVIRDTQISTASIQTMPPPINGPAYELLLTIDSYEYIVSAFGGYLDFRFFISNFCVNHFKSTLGNAVNLEPPAPAYTVYALTRPIGTTKRISLESSTLMCIK